MHLSQTQILIPTTHLEVIEIITIREEVIVPLNHTQVVDIHQVIAQDLGVQTVEEEVVQEEGNLKIYDYEKVHSICSYYIIIFNGFLFAVYRRYITIYKTRF